MSLWKSAFAVACIAGVVACAPPVERTSSQETTVQVAPIEVASVLTGIATAHDGDDLIINRVDLRLNGFDAPERGKRCGEEDVYDRATQELEAIVSEQIVHCEIVDIDRNGRPVARCIVNGEDVGQTMVSRGWARDWPRYSQRRFAEAEAEARASRRGIWGLECPADLWGTRNYD